MYTPPHRQDKTSHLAKGARAQNNIQTSGPSGATDRGKNHVEEWPRKLNVEAKAGHEILMTSMRRSSPLINQKSQEKPTHEIAFSSHDPIPAHCNGDDPLVIKAYIGGTMIHRIYVDGGSSAEILYDHCFQQLSATLKETLQPPTTPLIGFAGQSLWPLGVITLPLTMYDYNGRGSKTIVVEFMVVQAPSPYNAILGRPGMKKLGAIASTIHALIKFPIQSGITTVRGDIP
ncbi:reverse transcriptase domain-containing protein, partial [Tanacetum coccineum]